MRIEDLPTACYLVDEKLTERNLDILHGVMERTGARLIFGDMAIYSMGKNNAFNGISLPAIAPREQSGECRTVRRFGYRDFKGRV